MIQCDKEMSIIDVCRKVAREPNGRTVLRFAPKTSHQSNGFVEAVRGHIQRLSRCYQTQIETNTGVQLSAISPAIPFAIRYAGFVLSRFTVRPNGRTPFQYLPGTPYVSPLCMFGESVFALIPDHDVRAAKLTNRWISGCWWGRDASSDEHLVGTKHGLLECRSVRRKPPGEQWSRRETIEARGTKWNFDVEMDSGIPGPTLEPRRDERMPTATEPMEIPTVPPPAPPPEEHVPEMRGQGVHAKALRIRAFWSEIGRTPGCPACETPGPGKSHTRECKTYQDAWEDSRRTASAEEARRGIVGDLDTRPLDPSSSSTDPNPKRSKITSLTDDDSLANQMDEDNFQRGPATSHQLEPVDDENVPKKAQVAKNVFSIHGENGVKFDVNEEAWPKADLAIRAKYEGALIDGLPADKVKAGDAREIQQMKDLQLYSWVKETDIPPNKSILLTGWARLLKGSEVRSRCVLKDFATTVGDDVFAPTPSPLSVRGLLLCAAWFDLRVETGDLVCAFMQADSSCEMFARPPKGQERCMACEQPAEISQNSWLEYSQSIWVSNVANWNDACLCMSRPKHVWYPT